MASILGIVGSSRRWGNSEVLVRQALRGAQAEGACVQMLRLTDLHLESCTGCMRCAIGGNPCRIEDDMVWLIDAIQAADGVVLAVPTYFLGPAAVLKMVLDRLLMVTGQVNGPLPPVRPAITIATAGLAEWRGVTLPYLNALVTAFGFRPIESLTAIAPGPGEILLDDDLMETVLAAGHRLGRGDLQPAPVPLNTCPTCRCEALVLAGGRATCPICGCEAAVEQADKGMNLHFEPAAAAHQRWTPEGLRKHMTDWVVATGPRFMTLRSEIKTRRRPYRETEIALLRPPPREDKRREGS